MDPQARQTVEEQDVALPNADGGYGDYSQAEILEMLQEGEDSGICERPFEEIFDEIFEKHFGKEALIEAREARKQG